MPRVAVGFAEREVARVRAAAIAAFDEARARRWPFLSDVLERALRGVPVEDGAVLAAVVHALVKYDRLLGFAAGREDAGAKLDALIAILRAGPDERTELDARIEALPDSERRGVAYSFPDWLVARVASDAEQGGHAGQAGQGGEAVDAALARMNAIPPRVARANALRSTREACIEALATENVPTRPCAHAQHAFAIEGRGSPFRTQALARGDFEMQDEASQMVAELVAPPPGSLAIDACAGAGGKTLALAALLGGKGRLVALDLGDAKLDELRRRARRAGASNVRAIAVDLLDPASRAGALQPFLGAAARVLVDAPCTGLGAIRRNPEARWRLSPEQLDTIGQAQRALLRAAAVLVAPRGRIVYATCSFLRCEGEDVFESFLADHPAYKLVTARDVLGRARTEAVATADGRYLRTWRAGDAPGEVDPDGFFAAVARRTDAA
jgi:16S rRNA (cytosine967-C5)-methyltransferase